MNPISPDQSPNPPATPPTNQTPTTPPQPVVSSPSRESMQAENITTPIPQAQPSSISAQMDALLSEQTPTTSVWNQQPQVLQPPTEQQSVTEQQPISPDAKPKKAWTIATAWVAFVISTLFFLALGPGSIIMAVITSPYAWLVSYWWIPSVYAILTFVAPAIFILAGISIFFTYKKFPAKMRTVLILLSGITIGLPITWLSLNGIIPMQIIIYAIIMGVISIVPIILLIIFKIRDKKKAASLVPLKPTNEKTAKITFIVSLVIVAIELGFCILQLVAPVSNLIAIHEQEKQAEQAINSAAESSGSKSSKDLAKMVYAVCYGEYDVVYQSSDDTGLFECKENSEVFSVTDPHGGKSGYYDTASASFLGATYDETVAKYFPDTIYIYRNYLNADIYTDLILLVEANSEDEVINNYIDAIYGYIKDVNSKYTEEVRVSIFYTDKLDTVKSTRDYILLSGAVGLYDWLPHGNGLGEYYFKADEAAALMEIGENPSLYSSQTRDALKFHRHISAEIDNGKTITLEQLRAILQNSFEEGL